MYESILSRQMKELTSLTQEPCVELLLDEMHYGSKNEFQLRNNVEDMDKRKEFETGLIKNRIL